MKSIKWNSVVPFLIVCAFAAYTTMLTTSTCWGNTESDQINNEAKDSEPLFLKDIAPILDKQGCSAGLCHGKFGGQGGLNLSLLTLKPRK